MSRGPDPMIPTAREQDSWIEEEPKSPHGDPRDKVACACPRLDPFACVRGRHAMRRFTPAPGDPPIENHDDDECQCSCHDFCDCCGEDRRDCVCGDSTCEGCEP